MWQSFVWIAGIRSIAQRLQNGDIGSPGKKDFCEECRQYKRVIVMEWGWSRLQRILVEIIDNAKNS